MSISLARHALQDARDVVLSACRQCSDPAIESNEIIMSTRNKSQHAADLHRNHMDRLPGNQVAAETANTANTVLRVTRRVQDLTSEAEANSQEHFSHHKAKRSSPQLGETAEKVQSFLSAHRPTSPNSRTGTPSPTSTVNNYQQDQLITVSMVGEEKQVLPANVHFRQRYL